MLKENLSFVGICVLVFAALLGLAYLFERTVCRDLQRRSRSRNISYVAMFSALGGDADAARDPAVFCARLL
ncbi:MAG: hypothetical protein ACLSHG_13135 [Oscillospiraceae bacterium]